VWVHVFELSPLKMQQTVAILGCGPIGLIGIAMAKNAGCQVVACDRVPHRVHLAKAMGADIAVDIRDFRDAVDQATGGRGAHQVYDAAGAPETIHLGIQAARSGGRLTLIGIPTPLHFEVDLHTAMAKELSFQMMKRSNHKGVAAGALIAAGRIPFEVITHALPLEKAQEGFELVHGYRDGVGKVIFDI
jgi:L-iditol 2-dehydrogenase